MQMKRFIGQTCKCKTVLRFLNSSLTCVTKFWRRAKHSCCTCRVCCRRSRGQIMSLRIQRSEEVSNYQLPARFLGEIHIALSSLIIVCSIGTIANFYYKIPEEPPEEQMLDRGFILFVILTLLVSVIDICLSVLLICAAKQASLGKSLLWQRFTISLLIAYAMLTLAFGVLLSTILVLLGLLPSLIYKSFAIWVVNGLIWDLRGQIKVNFPAESLQALPSLGDGDEDKKSTTVFIFNKDTPDIVENKSLLTKASRANTNQKSSHQ